MRGIYAHKDKKNGTIFYVGQQRKNDIDRSHDFRSRKRNKLWWDYVKHHGGIDNIEVVWLYISHDDNESLFHIEHLYQKKYYELNPEIFACHELIQQGKLNSNYGCYWTDDMKHHMSVVNSGKYDGEKNPMYGISMFERMHGDKQRYEQWKKLESKKTQGGRNGRAIKCKLMGPNGFEKTFDYKGQMVKWFLKNISPRYDNRLHSAESINKTSYHCESQQYLLQWHWVAL